MRLGLPVRRLLASFGTGLALIAVGGCGSSSKAGTPKPGTATSAFTFTTARLDEKLRVLLSTPRSPATPSVPQTPSVPGTASTPTVAVSSVRCPPGTRPAIHASIQCTVTGSAGAAGSVTVTFDNDAGTSFHYDASLEGSTIKGKATLP